MSRRLIRFTAAALVVSVGVLAGLIRFADADSPVVARAGTAAVAAGKRSVTFAPGFDVTNKTKVLATVNSGPGTVSRVSRSAGTDRITITLAAPAKKKVVVAWSAFNGNQPEDRKDKVTRTMTWPAQSLNENPGQTNIQQSAGGLLWTNSSAETANLTVHPPADWAGGPVKIRLGYFRENSNPGNVQFRAEPRSFLPGATSEAGPEVLSDTVAQAAIAYHDTVITIPASSLQKGPGIGWEFLIERNDAVASPYPDPVRVRSVSFTYEAVG
jgi:hypothetical protein